MGGEYDAGVQSIIDALSRGINAAIDLKVYEETGSRTGPTFQGSVQAPGQPMRTNLAIQPDQGGAMTWLQDNWPILALGVAALLIARKLL